MCGIDIDFAQGTPVETIAYNWFKNGVRGCVFNALSVKGRQNIKMPWQERHKKINETQLSEAAKSSAFQLDKFFKVSSNTR